MTATHGFICRALFLATLTLLFTGCSYLKFPGVHKIDIQQGNIITQKMVEQLRPGMTKPQVRFVLGTPLIVDTFNQNRWDYFYSLKEGSGGESRETLSVFFDENGALTRFSGDFVPINAANTTAVEE